MADSEIHVREESPVYGGHLVPRGDSLTGLIALLKKGLPTAPSQSAAGDLKSVCEFSSRHS